MYTYRLNMWQRSSVCCRNFKEFCGPNVSDEKQGEKNVKNSEREKINDTGVNE